MGRELLVGNERVYMVGRVREVGLDFMTYKLEHLDQAGSSASGSPIYHSLVVPDPFINFSECRGFRYFCRCFPCLHWLYRNLRDHFPEPPASTSQQSVVVFTSVQPGSFVEAD